MGSPRITYRYVFTTASRDVVAVSVFSIAKLRTREKQEEIEDMPVKISGVEYKMYYFYLYMYVVKIKK